MSKNALPSDQERYSVYVVAKVVICFEVCNIFHKKYHSKTQHAVSNRSLDQKSGKAKRSGISGISVSMLLKRIRTISIQLN